MALAVRIALGASSGPTRRPAVLREVFLMLPGPLLGSFWITFGPLREPFGSFLPPPGAARRQFWRASAPEALRKRFQDNLFCVSVAFSSSRPLSFSSDAFFRGRRTWPQASRIRRPRRGPACGYVAHPVGVHRCTMVEVPRKGVLFNTGGWAHQWATMSTELGGWGGAGP